MLLSTTLILASNRISLRCHPKKRWNKSLTPSYQRLLSDLLLASCAQPAFTHYNKQYQWKYKVRPTVYSFPRVKSSLRSWIWYL